MERAEGGRPLLSVAAVARRLGVAPATLRTWDRRYGLGPSEHAAGAHRRYGGTDLARLIVMRRLTIDGVAPAEAAQIAREAEDDDLFDSLPATSLAAPVAVDPVASDALVDAVLAADDEATERLLALPRGGDVLVWWAALVEPARIAIARRTVVERPGVSSATVLERAALGALRAVVPAASTGQPVVLVLAPAVRPRLVPVHTVAAALAVRGVDARIVTGTPSARHVVELVAMTRASAAITVLESATSDVSAVERLARDWPDVPQFVVASDAAAARVPLGRSVVRARSIAGVVHETLAAVGVTGTGQSRASVRATTASHSG
jgi:DNA-binding transcriptional MerR regulator